MFWYNCGESDNLNKKMIYSENLYLIIDNDSIRFPGAAYLYLKKEAINSSVYLYSSEWNKKWQLNIDVNKGNIIEVIMKTEGKFDSREGKFAYDKIIGTLKSGSIIELKDDTLFKVGRKKEIGIRNL